MSAVSDPYSRLVGSDESDGTIAPIGSGSSYQNLAASTLGDWLKQSEPDARVYAMAGREDMAVLMGGRSANGVFWYEPETGGLLFSSSGIATGSATMQRESSFPEGTLLIAT